MILHPVAIVKAPTYSGICADLVLDGTLSKDPTGKLNIMWKVISEGHEDIDRYLRYLFCGCQDSLCENTFGENDEKDNTVCDPEETFETFCQNYQAASGLKITIPRRFLEYKEQLQLQLYVANVLGLLSQSDNLNVTVSTKPQLAVRMLTPTLRVRRRKLVEIKLSVHLPDCGYETPPKPTLEYDWTWSDATITPTNPTIEGQQRGVVPRKTALFIMPYTLGFDTKIVYLFNATVADSGDNYEGSTVSAKVTVIQEPLHLVISGNNGVVYHKSNIKLSASAIDPMANENDASGSFKWKCFQILGDGTKIQSFDGSGFTGTDLLLIPPSQQGFPIGMFEFHLKWKKEFRETQASVTLKISNSATATIHMIKPRDAILVENKLNINKNQILHLHAENALINSTIAWSVHKNKASNNIIDEFAEYLFYRNK